VTLIPFGIMLFQFVFSICCYDISRLIFDGEISDKPGNHAHIVWQFLFTRYRSLRILIYILMTCLLASGILLVIKLSDEQVYQWWPVFLPAYVCALAVTHSVITGCGKYRSIKHGNHKLDRWLMFIGIIFVWLFAFFLWAKLDDRVKWTWWVVMVPLWILFGVIVIAPIIISVVYCCCRGAVRRNSRWGNDAEFSCFLVVMCWIFLLAPILTWFVLVSQNLEQEKISDRRKYVVVFVPVFILQGLTLIGCVIADIVYYCC